MTLTASEASPSGATRGLRAPDFTLKDQTGADVRLNDLRGRVLIVYFFPKPYTPACTAEACAFRDASPEFEQLVGAATGNPSGNSDDAASNPRVEILGITTASVDTLSGFARRFRVPFRFLADEDGEVRRLWHVPRTFGLFPGRVTYVLDQNLIVREVITAAVRASAHVNGARAAVRAILGASTRR